MVSKIFEETCMTIEVLRISPDVIMPERYRSRVQMLMMRTMVKTLKMMTILFITVLL